jgi:hypothetical protein
MTHGSGAPLAGQSDRPAAQALARWRNASGLRLTRMITSPTAPRQMNQVLPAISKQPVHMIQTKKVATLFGPIALVQPICIRSRH